MGHADHEIAAAFSQFDHDGNQILDKDEQKRMKMELEEKRVSVPPRQSWQRRFCKTMMTQSLLAQFCFYMSGTSREKRVCDICNTSFQDALSAEIKNLGSNYEKETLERNPGTSSEEKSRAGQTLVDAEQFSR